MWRSRKRSAVVDGFAELAAQGLAVWQVLTPEERTRLVELGSELVTTKRWEAAQGFELSDEMVVTIAGGAALLILELGTDAYAKVGTIIVHPAAVGLTGTRPGAVAGTVTDATNYILGQANHQQGPLLIAWADARRSARRLLTANNVVLHEFAHKIDMLDGTVDGTPPMVRGDQLDTWIRVFTAKYQALRNGEPNPVLREYGATNPGEFFAVATEAFFGRALDLRDHEPELYQLLKDFYRQDPAARFEPLVTSEGIIRTPHGPVRVRLLTPPSGAPS